MGDYRCVVADANGKTSRVLRRAGSEEELVRSFAGGPSLLLSVEEARKPRSRRSGADRAALQFTEMMSLLVDSGLSLKDALELCASIEGNGAAGRIALSLLERVRKGSTFAQAVDGEADFFSPLYRGMVRIGDKVGTVEKILPRMSAYLAERKALRDKLAAALSYPLLVLSVSILGVFGLLLFVLPRMESIFQGFGGEAASKIQANIETLKTIFLVFCIVLLAIMVTAATLAIARRRNEAAEKAIDGRFLRIPVLGSFLSAMETLNFAFAMETLAAGGVPVESALEEASAVIGNRAYREAIQAVRSDALKGNSLSAAFAVRKEFPPYVSQWLAVGERSGQSEKVFAQIRTYFQKEVERKSGQFMTLIEPALIVLIGIVIAALVVVCVVPIFSMYGSIL